MTDDKENSDSLSLNYIRTLLPGLVYDLSEVQMKMSSCDFDYNKSHYDETYTDLMKATRILTTDISCMTNADWRPLKNVMSDIIYDFAVYTTESSANTGTRFDKYYKYLCSIGDIYMIAILRESNIGCLPTKSSSSESRKEAIRTINSFFETEWEKITDKYQYESWNLIKILLFFRSLIKVDIIKSWYVLKKYMKDGLSDIDMFCDKLDVVDTEKLKRIGQRIFSLITNDEFKFNGSPVTENKKNYTTFSYEREWEENNDTNKEEEKMENKNQLEQMFQGTMFGKTNGLQLALSGDIAVCCGDNSYKSYSEKTGQLTNVTGFTINGTESMFFLVPSIRVKKGDLIVLNGQYHFVIQVAANGNRIKVLDYNTNEVKDILPEKQLFMGKIYFYQKVVSPFGKMVKKSGGLMKMAMMSALFNGNNGNDDVQGNPFSSMFQGGNNSMMTMMMYSLMSNKGVDSMFDGLFDFDFESDLLDADDSDLQDMLDGGKEDESDDSYDEGSPKEYSGVYSI